MGDYSKIEQFLDQYLLKNGTIASGDEQKLESGANHLDQKAAVFFGAIGQ